MFSLSTLLTSPESFDRYIIASPSVWFAQHFIDSKLLGAKTLQALSNQVFLSVGEYEQALSPAAEVSEYATLIEEKLALYQQISNAKRVSDVLKTNHVKHQFLLIDGADHMLAGFASAIHSIPFAMSSQ